MALPLAHRPSSLLAPATPSSSTLARHKQLPCRATPGHNVNLSQTCWGRSSRSDGVCAAARGRAAVRAVAAASGSIAEEEKTSRSSEAGAGDNNASGVSAPESTSNAAAAQLASAASSTACQACGKAERVGGCNGEGRILGGLGAVPGFGWFPIKAYRPCPAFVEAGGRYKRQGQSLEEVAFGRTGKQDSLDISERLRGEK